MNDFRAEAVCFNEATILLVSGVQNHDLLFLQVRPHCRLLQDNVYHSRWSTVYHC